MSSRFKRRASLQTQPRTFKLSLNALLALPYRLCNPPPAVGKVRSCGVTPVFQVQLEDILNRKHLPPLGLKDFEEWLMYVELCPENLYFILWLKDYTEKYNQWSVQSKSQSSERQGDHLIWPAQNSSQLALFYVRAKQTFFTPGSDYELNVPSDILSPFYTSNFGSPHPDPSVFAQVASEVKKMLKQSLERFVVAAYTNVGTNRGWCGTVGGTLFILLGSVPPIVYNFLSRRSRWLRLLALPGMWLGLTILVTSLCGVCLMVYLFGDLRQLRKFELSRPPISGPQPLFVTRRRRPISFSIPPVDRPPTLPITEPPRISVITPPPPSHCAMRRNSYQMVSTLSSHSQSSFASSSASSDSGAGEIHISPAYFDEVFVGDNNESPPVADPIKGSISLDHSRNATSSFAPTASFIHPFDHFYDEDDLAGNAPLPEQLQPLSSFDFDSLPPRSNSRSDSPPTVSVASPNIPDTIVIQPEEPPKMKLSPKAIVAYVQAKCSIHKWKASVPMMDPEKATPSGFTPQPHPLPADFNPQFIHRRRGEVSTVRVQTQFKMIKAVPAFASPLTRVLSPVVARAQWEIVVRSAAVALLISWIVLGSLLAVPVRM